MNAEKKRDVCIYELLELFVICSANGFGDRICSDGPCCIANEWSYWNSACVLNHKERTRE